MPLLATSARGQRRLTVLVVRHAVYAASTLFLSRMVFSSFVLMSRASAGCLAVNILKLKFILIQALSFERLVNLHSCAPSVENFGVDPPIIHGFKVLAAIEGVVIPTPTEAHTRLTI